MAGDLVNVAEAAELLGYSRRTIARMAADGRLTPVHKLPGIRGDYLFNRADLEQFAAMQPRRAEGAAS